MVPPPSSLVTSFDWNRLVGCRLLSYVPSQIIVQVYNMIVSGTMLDYGGQTQVYSYVDKQIPTLLALLASAWEAQTKVLPEAIWRECWNQFSAPLRWMWFWFIPTKIMFTQVASCTVLPFSTFMICYNRLLRSPNQGLKSFRIAKVVNCNIS